MVPKQHSARSFRAVSGYLLHDKNARTDERVAWTEADNTWTREAGSAWREMQQTAAEAEALKQASGVDARGRKSANPALHLSLSWARDEAPSREQMLEAARDALKTLGLEKHQALIVCHNDEPHPHVHILASRIDPDSGRVNRLQHSKRKLSDWALNYEREQGQIRCEQRAENQHKRAAGDKPRYGDPAIRNAWEQSDTGKAFQSALAEQGYTLAQGNKRIVVVDPQGKAINPARQLHGVKAAELNARLGDLERGALPRVDEVRKARAAARGDQGAARRETPAQRPVGKEKGAAATFDRDRYHAAWQAKVDQAGIDKAHTRAARERFGEAARADSARAQVRGGGAGASPANDNARRAALQSRHLDEQGALGRRQDRKRLDREEQLAAFYDTRREREALTALETKRWPFKRDREQMEALRRTIADAERRAQEARDGQRRAFERERAALHERQERERRELERQLAGQVPDASREAGRDQGAAPTRARERTESPAPAPSPGGRQRRR